MANIQAIRSYHLYFSQAWHYRNTLDELLGSLANRADFSFLPFHFQVQQPEEQISEQELYRVIKDKVKRCDAIILMCGVYTKETYGRWINKEIISAKGEFDKPIIAVHWYPELKISAVVRQNADLIVGADPDKLILGIKELTL